MKSAHDSARSSSDLCYWARRCGRSAARFRRRRMELATDGGANQDYGRDPVPSRRDRLRSRTITRRPFVVLTERASKRVDIGSGYQMSERKDVRRTHFPATRLDQVSLRSLARVTFASRHRSIPSSTIDAVDCAWPIQLESGIANEVK